MTTYKSSLDGARAVRVSENNRLIIVWKGGVTFNVYEAGSTIDNLTESIRCSPFELSDDLGNPVNQETAEQKMDEMMEEFTDE